MDSVLQCNLGISSIKLLDKMDYELKKPNVSSTLFHDEIEEKLWPMDVRDLFGVGAATELCLDVVVHNFWLLLYNMRDRESEQYPE